MLSLGDLRMYDETVDQSLSLDGGTKIGISIWS